MTEEERQQQLELYRSQPERYTILSNGAVRDEQLGRIVANLGGPNNTFITKETSPEFHDLRRQLGLISQLRGLARSQDVELGEDAPLEQIVQGAGNAVEALTKHMAGTFLTSKNLRGMGETYRALTAPMVGDAERREEEKLTDTPQLVVLLIEAVRTQKPVTIIDLKGDGGG